MVSFFALDWVSGYLTVVSNLCGDLYENIANYTIASRAKAA